MKLKVLIVEDDPAILHLIDVALTLDYYIVIKAKTGKDALFYIRTEQPDIILLDLGLPDMEGIDLIREVRTDTSTPIIVVSARLEEQTIIHSLDSGANDYVTKPFNVDELRARIRVAQRLLRDPEEMHTTFENGPLVVDFEAQQITMNHEDIHLTPSEFRLLELLCKHVGKVITYRYILKALFGYVNENEMASLRVHMTSLRNKLNRNDQEVKLIRTHPRIGYQMVRV